LFPVGHPEQRFTTQLAWIASAAKSLSRNDPVKYLPMRAPIPGNVLKQLDLVPGQQLQARVVLLQADKGIDVPNIALGDDNGAAFVQVRERGDFKRRKVTVGVRGPARTQVLSGLSAGDEVLLVEAGPLTEPGKTGKVGGAP
jgi:hypothetical protein